MLESVKNWNMLLIIKSALNPAEDFKLDILGNRELLNVLDLGKSSWEVVNKDGYCNESLEGEGQG